MARQNVYRYATPESYDETELAGWFNPDSATAYPEGTRWDGHNHVSLVTSSQWEHETLYRTRQGRWVLHHWSQWVGSKPTWEYVTDEQARAWLLRSEYPSDEVAAATGADVPEETGPGRPEIGPAINVRLPVDLLARLDAWATSAGVTRAEAVRRAVAQVVA